MDKVYLNETDPYAVCNDGTSGIYYWKESPSKSNQWFIYLGGGAWCYSYESCEIRKQDDYW